MSNPKLTEAEHDAVWRAAYDPDGEALPNLVARMVAEAWEVGYAKGIQVGESGLVAGTDRHMAKGRNPYRSTP